MKSGTARKWATVAGLAVLGLLVLVTVLGGVVVGTSRREAARVRQAVASRPGRPVPLPAAERDRVVVRARSLRRPVAPEPVTSAPAPATAGASAPEPPPASATLTLDQILDRDPSERPIERWLRAIRISREPGPAPPPEVLALLQDAGPALDALAHDLEAARIDDATWLVEPDDLAATSELEHARVLLLASACAESLDPGGDRVRGDRLLEAAWTISRGLPPRVEDVGPGELFLAVLRQVRVEDPRAWSERLESVDLPASVAEAFEAGVEARYARWELEAQRRQQVRRSRVPAVLQQAIARLETDLDLALASRVASSELDLARDARALAPCDDPWTLARPRTSNSTVLRFWPGRGHVRFTVTLAMAARAQADVALTQHVLERRHGLDGRSAACRAEDLVERPLGDGRFVVGWRAPGRIEPGRADRPTLPADVAFMRTWPEPSVQDAPLLDAFTFVADEPRVPVLASAPAPFATPGASR